jgi:hypothetical protein
VTNAGKEIAARASEFSKRSCSQNRLAKSCATVLTRRHTAVRRFFK